MRIFKFKFQLNNLSMLLCFLICFAGSSAYAQANKNKVEGEIVMSKAELESLLTKIVEKRKESLKNREVVQMPVYQQRMGVVYPNPQSYQNPIVYQEIKDLEYKIDLLLSRANINGTKGSNTTYILPSQVAGMPLQSALPNTVINMPKQNPNFVGQTTIIDTVIRVSDISRKVLKSQQVFFANNSVKIGSKDQIALMGLIPLIKQNQNNLLVVLKGFASQVGNAFYNNQLSYNRADVIKQILVKNGVNPSNIMILNHGADSTVNEAEARRVEVSLELIDQK